MLDASQENLTGLRKAAILMVLLGDKVAASVYRHLSQAEVEELTREIAHVNNVPPELALHTLSEFSRRSPAQTSAARGGAEYAHRLLVSAFGEGRAQDVIEQVMRKEAFSPKDQERIESADAKQLARLLEDENPQTIALLLAHVGAQTASAVIAHFPPKLGSAVVERVAKMRPLTPEVVRNIVGVLHKKIEGLGEQRRVTQGGIEGVAQILNRMRVSLSSSLLESLEQGDAELAQSIRDQMFTFRDFLAVSEAALREVVSQIDRKLLAAALKGAPPELKTHFMKVMSSRAAEILNEEIETLGNIRASEITEAQRGIVQTARKLETEGKIVLRQENNA